MMQIWSRYGQNFDPTKPSYSTEWLPIIAVIVELQGYLAQKKTPPP